jgi:predicted  nucleic acid-binding Zn-ribbon protein
VSIRQLAAELYQVTKKVEELEKKLSEALSETQRRAIESELKEAKAERDRLRQMLDKAKGS